MSSSNIVTLQHHYRYHNWMRYILVFFVTRCQNTELVSCESLQSTCKSWSIISDLGGCEDTRGQALHLYMILQNVTYRCQANWCSGTLEIAYFGFRRSRSVAGVVVKGYQLYLILSVAHGMTEIVFANSITSLEDIRYIAEQLPRCPSPT